MLFLAEYVLYDGEVGELQSKDHVKVVYHQNLPLHCHMACLITNIILKIL